MWVAIRRVMLLGAGAVVLVGCVPDDFSPPTMFARDENGAVVVYVAQCEADPPLFDTLKLNRIDRVHGSDGRLNSLDATTIWQAVASDRSGPVALPDRLPIFEIPPGMNSDNAAADVELDVEAEYRLVAFGADSINGANFAINELRQHSGEFDLAGRRFDDPVAMRVYACSDEWNDNWAN